MPVLAIILGPSKLGVYNSGFVEVSTIVLFLLLGIVTGGVAASAWAFKIRIEEQKDSQIHIESKDSLPNHAREHLLWTTLMLVVCSLFWWYLLIF
jgi:H+/Cl- antiporter ClcA